MKKQVLKAEDRLFITKEFADTLAGKNPAPYLRMHDPVQQALVALARYDLKVLSNRIGLRPYVHRMIHFWREISLAGFSCAEQSMDECYALLFESAFGLAQLEPDWAIECFSKQSCDENHLDALQHLASQVRGATITHTDLVSAFTSLYAPRREQTNKWQDPSNVALAGELWFWAALALASGTHKSSEHSTFRRAIAESAASDWHDCDRLHIRMIREAPQRAVTTSRADTMAHPLLRMARRKYREESAEQSEVLRFLNAQCIRAGFESEEQYFSSDLMLAQWVRDARHWAMNLRSEEPNLYEVLIQEAKDGVLERTRCFYHTELGSNPEQVDSLDATAALMQWAKRQRGFDYSKYRAQLWEFVVEIVDAALWLGWLFPLADRES